MSDRRTVARPRRIPWLWPLVLVAACLYISGVSAEAIVEWTPQSSAAACLVERCLDSEEAYAAYLEPSEPVLPWEQIRSVRFQDGEVVVELVNPGSEPMWASLDPRRID